MILLLTVIICVETWFNVAGLPELVALTNPQSRDKRIRNTVCSSLFHVHADRDLKLAAISKLTVLCFGKVTW